MESDSIGVSLADIGIMLEPSAVVAHSSPHNCSNCCQENGLFRFLEGPLRCHIWHCPSDDRLTSGMIPGAFGCQLAHHRPVSGLLPVASDLADIFAVLLSTCLFFSDSYFSSATK